MTSLRQLRFLVALQDTGNFTRAAEACHVSQPALSTGLREMEARLGITVAERDRHSVRMTETGRVLAERARRILADVDEFEALARSHAGGLRGDIRLGAIPTVGPFLVPRALPALRAAFPDLRFFLREELTESLLAGLEDGRLDVIIVALPFPHGAAVRTEALFSDGYQLATPRAHPLAGQPLVTGPDLARAGLLLLEKGHCLQRHALSALEGAGQPDSEAFAATSLSTLLSMVEEGLGITLVPQLAIDAGAVHSADIALTPLPEACPRQVVLMWRQTSARTELFLKIAAIIREVRRTLAAIPA